MQLICIVPGWHAAVTQRSSVLAPEHRPEPGIDAGVDGWTSAADDGGLIWTVRRDAARCWWSATVEALGLGGDGAATAGDLPARDEAPDQACAMQGAPAANDWAARTGEAAPAGLLLRADPVSLQADRDSAILHPAGALKIDEAESAHLIRDLNAFLADDGLTLRALTPTEWYLSGSGLPPLRGPSPDALAFRSLETRHQSLHEASGASADAEERHARRRLRTLQSELEMVLHAHPVNAGRGTSHRPVITGLHLWGASGPWPGRADTSRPRPDVVIGESAFVRCAAAAAEVSCRDALFEPDAPGTLPGGPVLLVDLSLRDAWLDGDAGALEDARARFVEARLTPLRTAGLDAAGLQVVAEAGWRHTVQAPPRITAGSLIARARELVAWRGRR